MILAQQQVRRPLIGVALSMVFGLMIQNRSGGSPLLLLSLSAFLLSAACLFRRTDWLVYLSCGVLAASYGAVKGIPVVSHAVLAAAEMNSREQTLTGSVADEPVASDGTVTFLFRTDAVHYQDAPLFSESVLRVYWRNASEPVHFGEKWQLTGQYTGYERPRGGATGSFSVSRADGARRLGAAGAVFAGKCYQVRQQAAALLRQGVEFFPEQTRLIHAMLLGYRQAIPAELNRVFTRTGTLHIFAISGQHVVMLAAILIAGLKLCGVSRPCWGLLLVPVLSLYIFTTGLQPSALRALTMASVCFAAPLAGRRPDAPSAVALAAILLLAVHPEDISDPGFLLSFAVVCGLIMVHGWATRQIQLFRLSGWAVPLQRIGKTHLTAALLRNTGLLALTSLAAWLFSAPVAAGFFNTLSPAALIGNLAVVPLTFMIMLAGCLALAGGAVFLPTAALFNQANLLLINLLIWIVRQLSLLPGACFAVRSPSALVTGLWYAGLVFFFTGPARWRKGACLLVVLSALLWGTAHIELRRGIKVLREGNSAVALRLSGNRWVLVTDGNPFSAARTVRRLQKEGVNRLDALVVSNTRADSATVRQFEEIFRPRQVVTEGCGWISEDGTIRLTGLPETTGFSAATPSKL